MSTAPTEPVSTAVLDQFEELLPRLWQWSGITVDDPSADAATVRKLIEIEGPSSPLAAKLLSDTQIRERWNTAFAERRSTTLADWITPYIKAPLLDVLAGDLSLTRELAEHGIAPIVATERLQDYEQYLHHDDIRLIDHVENGPLPGDQVESVLICTVLHHEPDPIALLDRVVAKNAKRWVVVENCLEENFDREFHEFVDTFFNTCLNRIGIPCVDQHRTAEEWSALLSNYGNIVAADIKTEVPGIPFPYRMFVVQF